METKPYYPLDPPEAVKSLPIRSNVETNFVPPSDKGVYAVADLMKLAPTTLQHKYKSLLTPKMVTKQGVVKEDKSQDDTTQINATEGAIETTTDRNGQPSIATTKRKAVDNIIGHEVIADSGTADEQRPACEGDQEDGAVAVAGEGEKKRKKKSKGARNPDGTKKPKTARPTGFEEFYTEGPIVPDVYEDEVNNIYH